MAESGWFAPPVAPLNTTVDADAVRHLRLAYGEGGDDGGVPPLFLWTMGEPLAGDPPLDVETVPTDLAAGRPAREQWTFARPLRLGERVRLRIRCEPPSYERLYLDADGDELARCVVELRTTPWPEAPTTRRHVDRGEVARIEASWRDEPADRWIRGPLTVTDTVVRLAGVGPGGLIDVRPFAPVPVAWAVELPDPETDRPAGDAGRHRSLWMMAQVLRAAGAGAWLRALDLHVHEPAWEGDVHVVETVADGRVTTTTCTDQEGRVTASARGRIEDRSTLSAR